MCETFELTLAQTISLNETMMKTGMGRYRITAVFGHELRKSLGIVQGALDSWRGRAPSDLDDLRHLLERQLRLLNRLSEDLLSNEGNLAGCEMSLQRMPVCLSEILTVAIEQVRPSLRQRMQKLNLSSIDESLVIQGDASRLAQVFLTLLQNASEFTQVDGSVFVSLCADGRQAITRIRDNGKGISANDLVSVLDDCSAPEGCYAVENDGFGEGLGFVQTIVASHGGSIMVKSDGIGLGSEFIVRFPIIGQLSDLDVAATESENLPGTYVSSSFLGISIARKDDDACRGSTMDHSVAIHNLVVT